MLAVGRRFSFRTEHQTPRNEKEEKKTCHVQRTVSKLKTIQKAHKTSGVRPHDTTAALRRRAAQIPTKQSSFELAAFSIR